VFTAIDEGEPAVESILAVVTDLEKCNYEGGEVEPA
jgi:hypothetical protein